jgi:hypothetical protein
LIRYVYLSSKSYSPSLEVLERFKLKPGLARSRSPLPPWEEREKLF